MFHDVEYKGITVQREDLDIPNRFTTNPQAEILVFSDIPLEYVDEVICESISEKQVLEDEIERLPIDWNRNFFHYRDDYEIWQAISKADSGEADFQKKLGRFYEDGDCVNKDLTQAVLWYRKASGRGNAAAKNQLGYLHFKGEGVDHDIKEAVEFFQSSADLGCAMAQFNLGLCYEEGHFVEKNLSEAEKWYQKAEHEGDRRLQKKARKKIEEIG
jgi:TPR repeat protein